MELHLEPPYLIIKPGLSEDDFYRLAGEDSDWEYLDGRIVMYGPASDRHEDLTVFLLTLLRYFLDEKGGARVRGSRYPMRLDERWSPEPDVLVVRDEHGDRMTPRRLEGAADLVIEIVSESDSHLVYREKLPRYRQAGIPEIWIVDPLRREVLAETREPPGESRHAMKSGRLESAVVPGFRIDVEWLWETVLPSTARCLREILGR